MIHAVFLAIAPSPGTSAVQEKVPFDCRLVLSIDRSLEDRWLHTAGEEGVYLPEASEVVRKQYFGTYMFFPDARPDAEGRARVRYDVRIERPDGELYHEEKDLEALDRKLGERPGVILSDTTLFVCFEPEDPLGEYEVRVDVRDLNSERSGSARKPIRLVEYTQGRKFEDEEEISDWFVGYHRSPDPHRAIPAFLRSVELGSWSDPDRRTPLTAFFREVFKSNDWLPPILLEGYADRDAETRRATLELLAECAFDSKGFLDELGKEDRAIWKDLSRSRRRNPIEDPITHPGHLDDLWGTFFASGRFAPVRRLCDALSPEETGAVPKGELRNAIQDTAEWSIGSNAEHHELVRMYCEWILENDEIPDALRSALKKALER